MKTPFQIAIGSVFVGLAVLALKAMAWWLTGSVALLSDALESTVNVATALAALWAIRVAAQPPDAAHPYGHHKAEFFSAVLEGVMIIIAAILILHEAYKGFLAPRLLDAPTQGLAINALASVLNAGWSWFLIARGRALRSPALVADGHHLFTDVISSVGVLIGVGLAVATGWALLDPLLAGAVALHILWSGWQVTTTSLSGLMDEAVANDTLAQIRDVIAREATGAIEAHDLKTRHAGRATFIEFDLVVPGSMTVEESHQICDRIEAALRETVSDARINIHVEPETKAQHKGVPVV